MIRQFRSVPRLGGAASWTLGITVTIDDAHEVLLSMARSHLMLTAPEGKVLMIMRARDGVSIWYRWLTDGDLDSLQFERVMNNQHFYTTPEFYIVLSTEALA